MSEQKFYTKHRTHNRQYEYTEATPEDFEKAGWVKRKKVNMEFEKWDYCDCGKSLLRTCKYCSDCGAELIWRFK